MVLAEPVDITRRVAQVLENLGIRYFVGDSLASSLHGIPRATQDVDIVADIESVDLDVAAGVEIIESDRERHGGKPDAQAVDDLRAVRREVPGRVSAVRIQADRTAARGFASALAGHHARYHPGYGRGDHGALGLVPSTLGFAICRQDALQG